MLFNLDYVIYMISKRESNLCSKKKNYLILPQELCLSIRNKYLFNYEHFKILFHLLFHLNESL